MNLKNIRTFHNPLDYNRLKKMEFTNSLNSEVNKELEDFIKSGFILPYPIIIYHYLDDNFTIISGGELISTILNTAEVRVKKYASIYIEITSLINEEFTEEFLENFI